MKKHLFVTASLLIIALTSCGEVTNSGSISSGSDIVSDVSNSESTLPSSSVSESNSSSSSTSISVSRPSIPSESTSPSTSVSPSESSIPSTSEIPSSSTPSTSTSENYGYNHVDPSYTGTYYKSVSESLRDKSLIIKLDDILDDDANDSAFSYGGLNKVYPKTDGDPKKSGNLIGFYSGTSAAFSGSFSGTFNREHVWPNSRKGEAAEDDPHVTRPTLVKDNSDRGNSYYGDTTGWDPASCGNEKYRGIAARIIFYAAVRYQDNGLYLDDLANPTSTNSNQVPTMGKVSKLLEWNLKYDIDATEIQRNEALVSNWGHCRNPFIDDRNYACKIWGGLNSTTKAICGM